ncbi:MAG: ABC transporter permease [Pseudomonadota bacterium]
MARLRLALWNGAPVLFFAAILFVWQAAVAIFAIPSFLLPSPTAIVAAGLAVAPETWLAHIQSTLWVTLIGYFISIAVSIPLAVAVALSPIMSRTVYPLLIVVQSTPIVAVAPILIVALGAGDVPRVVITCLIAFFPLVVSTATGLLATPSELVELSRSLRAPRVREVTQIRLMFAVPYIFSALKISITLAVIGAVVAEFVAAENGLGYFILYSTSFFKVPQAFAALFVLVAISLALFRLVALAQQLLFPWSLPSQSRS